MQKSKMTLQSLRLPRLPRIGGARNDQLRARRLVDRADAAQRRGATAEALQLCRDAIRLCPGFAPARASLGIALESSGDLAGAVDAYKEAIAVDPGCASAHYRLAMAHVRAKKYAEAEERFRVALGLEQPFPEAWIGLASALEGLGRYEEALTALRNATIERPDHAGAMFDAASLFRKTGRAAEAIAHDQRGLEIEPEHCEVHHRLARDFWESGRLVEAEGSLRQALALDPGFVDAELDLARVLSLEGRETEALQRLFGAVARHPESRDARRALIERLGAVKVTSVGGSEHAVLLDLCRNETASLRPLASTLVELFAHWQGFDELQRCADLDRDPLAATEIDGKALLADDLFLTAWPRLPLMSLALERVVTHVRRHLLLRLRAVAGSKARDTFSLRLACAIARQCFLSGYPMFVAEDEQRALGEVRELVRSAIDAPGTEPCAIEALLAVMAMYEYLDEMPYRGRLSQVDGWSPAFQAVRREQIANHEAEREIAWEVQAIGVVTDRTSRAVQQQYEDHPYPVWTGLYEVVPSTIDSLSQRLQSGSRIPASASSRILVAGCGTGEHSIQVARTYPRSEVLAVDLSRSSLAYAARATRQFGLSNVTYRQADILDLDQLQERFALIECCGVLHHLAAPMIGWRVLVELLDDAGFMRIGLYSARAREHAGIEAARAFARSSGFASTTDGVRKCRRAIIELPDGHPAKKVTSSGDFYSLNGCRDLIMHVQEHSFTLPKLGDCLDSLGLRFLGFECSLETKQRFREMFPHDAAVVDLDAWDRFEAQHPSTFAAMYLFWCGKESPSRPRANPR